MANEKKERTGGTWLNKDNCWPISGNDMKEDVCQDEIPFHVYLWQLPFLLDKPLKLEIRNSPVFFCSSVFFRNYKRTTYLDDCYHLIIFEMKQHAGYTCINIFLGRT